MSGVYLGPYIPKPKRGATKSPSTPRSNKRPRTNPDPGATTSRRDPSVDSITDFFTPPAQIVAALRHDGVPVYEPGQVEYERSVGTDNLLYRFTRPLCVVQPQRSIHVQTAVKLARQLRLPMSIKGGGHSYSGSWTTMTGILLDMRQMNNVKLNLENQFIEVQGGARWGDVYRPLINNHHDGWVPNGGRCPSVGVAGFLLGGGLGPFTRDVGMGCDSVISVTIVTADGQLVKVGEGDPPDSPRGRLFWALRGCGGGNYGMVVRMKLRVHRLRDKAGAVTAGRYVWKPDAEDREAERTLLRSMSRFYTTEWSRRMTLDSTWLAQTSTSGPGDITIRFLAYYNGNQEGFNTEIQKARFEPALERQLQRRVLEERSTRFLHESLVYMWSEEDPLPIPGGADSTFRMFSGFCFTADLDTIRQVTQTVKSELDNFLKLFESDPNCIAQATFIHSGGRASDNDGADTAFRWRDTMYHVYIEVTYRDKWLERDMRGFLGGFKDRLKPLATEGRAAYICFPDRSLADNVYEEHYYGANLPKLQQIKQEWDPTDFFNGFQAIKLPGAKRQPSPKPGPSGRTGNSDSSTPPISPTGSVGSTYSFEEEAMTDKLATERWDHYVPPPASPDTTFGRNGSGGEGSRRRGRSVR
ncbi:hypothetical protein F4778DRAFT_737609 [Xylariomycetidae sp. FL2044]|nr:hypothetical protein F4778DRAFT_737609 [Xylariomycetidae sp. FL2044]